MASRELKPIIRPEDLEERLRRAAERLAESGREAGEEARGRMKPREVFRMMETPKYAEEFLSEARRALEEEVAIAQEVVGDPETGEGPIHLSERELEVTKRALVRLKLPQLQRLAISIDLDSRGNQEDLVDRIAREYRGDPTEVARLVLEFQEATPERGLVDRLYSIREPIRDLDGSAHRLADLSGRYIRVGIARWFVFSRARVDDSGLWLEGLYYMYSADAKREGDDFELVSVPSAARVSARIRRDQSFVEVRARGEAESRAIIRALEWGTSLRHAAEFLVNTSALRGRLMGWDPRSVFMLAFLDRRLPDGGIDIINLTSVKFETAAAERRFTRTPTVRSVALQGQHLFSSRAACELLIEGRGLVEISLAVRFRPDAKTELIFPLRITLGPDHLSVLTGFGSHTPEAAAELHREVVQRLRAAVSAGTTSDEQLEALAERIYRRAESDEPVEQADIFAPPGDWLEDDETER